MQKNDQTLIYLDHNATTPIDPTAIEIMTRYINDEFGNPSSAYPLGVRAKEILETARQDVASLIGCKNKEVIFTSGGSESNNMALKGLVNFREPERYHIITSAVEHPAVLNPALYLMELGVKLTILPVDRYGRVSPDDVEKAIIPDTCLISIMLANNETGTLNPVKEISKISKRHNIPLHTDAAQAVGKINVDVNELGVDLLSMAGHKVYGPKGVGALFIREGLALTPLIHGAGQEFGKRAGTENVILAAGLGAASRVAGQRLKQDIPRIKALRDRLQEVLFKNIKGLVLNGHPEERLPNTLNISVPHMEGARILEGLPSLAASTGAACHDRSVRLSHVLAAMNVSPEVGMGALRLSLGRGNDISQVEKAAGLLIDRVKEMRGSKAI
jgi:cysteine desulfurase